MKLITNSSHGNGIYTFINEDNKLVIKSSVNKEGISSLKREFCGYQWYFNLTNNKNAKSFFYKIHSTDKYYRLSVNLFQGKIGNSNLSLSDNYLLILKAIEHYVSLWPKKKNNYVALHGDFSVGNIIYGLENIVIIDWEHFSLNSAPWGFDLVNMLYESVFMSMPLKNKLSERNLECFLLLRNKISELLKEVPNFKCSLEDLNVFMNKNEKIWGKIIAKFPVLKFTSKQKMYIKEIENI
jgi:hypothetical protein